MAQLNPYRPGAGQTPLYLAGREDEKHRFAKLVGQRPVLRNLITSGLRGVGKTVLLENLKPIAQSQKWLWTGNDLSESASLTEEKIAKRLITDLSILLSPILAKTHEQLPLGFLNRPERHSIPVSFDDLWQIFEGTPGLVEDKLKAVIRKSQDMLVGSGINGIVFAYDEAQNLADHAREKEYPLSILLDVLASLQRNHHEVQILLVLCGLPTLFPKLNEARTYTERMFDIMMLDKLNEEESKRAIEEPIAITESSLSFAPETVDEIVSMSGGYPYFIQYICKETFDAWISQIDSGVIPSVSKNELLAKLDQDFFAARWERATDRQQEFMLVIASLENSSQDFTTQEIVEKSKELLEKGFSSSHANQILSALLKSGFVYKNKHGKYSFAVPLLSEFILRQDMQP